MKNFVCLSSERIAKIDFTRLGQARDLCQTDSRVSGCDKEDDTLPMYSNRRARKAMHADTKLIGAQRLLLAVLSLKRLIESSTASQAMWILQSICWRVKLHGCWSQSFSFLLQRKRSSALPCTFAQAPWELSFILISKPYCSFVSLTLRRPSNPSMKDLGEYSDVVAQEPQIEGPLETVGWTDTWLSVRDMWQQSTFIVPSLDCCWSEKCMLSESKIAKSFWYLSGSSSSSGEGRCDQRYFELSPPEEDWKDRQCSSASLSPSSLQELTQSWSLRDPLGG